MSFKSGIFFVAIFVVLGSIALPLQDVKQDMSNFFDHVDWSARIIGGTPAGYVPYMVSLTNGANVRTLVCGGSLVTTRHVLTAAHCVAPGIHSNFRGNVGSNRFAEGGTSYTFSRAIMHPNFHRFTIKNDVAILVTRNSVALSSSVSLVSLSFDYVGAGVPTTATGWGITSNTGPGPFSQVLLRLNGVTVDGNECVARVLALAQLVDMVVPPVDPRVEICSFSSNTRGTCGGDSGSPLLRSDRNQQIGLVSWGLSCARGAPDVFTRLSAFRSWIEQNIRYHYPKPA